MNHHIETLRTEEVTDEQLSKLGVIAGRGFGTGADSPSMLEDTRNHVTSADLVQLLTFEGDIRAFALYKELLWR